MKSATYFALIASLLFCRVESFSQTSQQRKEIKGTIEKVDSATDTLDSLTAILRKVKAQLQEENKKDSINKSKPKK